VNRATFFGLAKGNTAIHAASALSIKALNVMLGIDFVEVQKTFLRRAVRCRVAGEFYEAGRFTHIIVLYTCLNLSCLPVIQH
jgi:hypothetical protein